MSAGLTVSRHIKAADLLDPQIVQAMANNNNNAQSSNNTAAIQYDLAMAKYALERALSKLPPEVVSNEPLNLDLSFDQLFGSLHQEFRTAIFSVEQISTRISAEGIGEQQFSCPPPPPPVHNDVPYVDIGWELPRPFVYPSPPVWTTTSPLPGIVEPSSSVCDTSSMHVEPGTPVASTPQQTPTEPSTTSQAGDFYFAFEPSDAEYSALPSSDQYVAPRLWSQLEPLVCSDATQDLWQIATRKLAQLRKQGKEKGTWSDHVVKETATWRTLKTWQAVRQDLMEQQAMKTCVGGEQLRVVDQILAAMGENL